MFLVQYKVIFLGRKKLPLAPAGFDLTLFYRYAIRPANKVAELLFLLRILILHCAVGWLSLGYILLHFFLTRLSAQIQSAKGDLPSFGEFSIRFRKINFSSANYGTWEGKAMDGLDWAVPKPRVERKWKNAIVMQIVLPLDAHNSLLLRIDTGEKFMYSISIIDRKEKDARSPNSPTRTRTITASQIVLNANR